MSDLFYFLGRETINRLQSQISTCTYMYPVQCTLQCIMYSIVPLSYKFTNEFEPLTSESKQVTSTCMSLPSVVLYAMHGSIKFVDFTECTDQNVCE